MLFLLCLATGACGKEAPAPPAELPGKSARTSSEPPVTCPVCGLTFPKEDADGFVDVKGKRYYFYLKDHKDAFVAAPDAFLQTAASPKQ